MVYGISLQFCLGGMTTDNATFLLVVLDNIHTGKASLGSAHTGAEEILTGKSCCLVSVTEEYIGWGWLFFFFALTHLLDVGLE